MVKAILCPFQIKSLWCNLEISTVSIQNSILREKCERMDCPLSPKYQQNLVPELQEIYNLVADQNNCRYEAGLKRLRFLLQFLTSHIPK
jgi:hypothetical protein